MLAVQLSHSGEEYLNGMPKKFPWFKLGLRNYLLFEIPFNIFWVWVLFDPDLPYRNELMYFFIFLMFANGIWHVAWSAFSKKYTPGLITASLFIITFILFYFKV